MRIRVLSFIALLLTFGPAHADKLLFTYNPSSLTGWSTGPGDITGGVLAWSFSDGHERLSNLDSTSTFWFTRPQNSIPTAYSPSGMYRDIYLTGASYTGAFVIDRAAGAAGSGTCGVSWWTDCSDIPLNQDGSLNITRGGWMLLLLIAAGIVGVGAAWRFYRSQLDPRRGDDA